MFFLEKLQRVTGIMHQHLVLTDGIRMPIVNFKIIYLNRVCQVFLTTNGNFPPLPGKERDLIADLQLTGRYPPFFRHPKRMLRGRLDGFASNLKLNQSCGFSDKYVGDAFASPFSGGHVFSVDNIIDVNIFDRKSPRWRRNQRFCGKACETLPGVRQSLKRDERRCCPPCRQVIMFLLDGLSDPF